MTVKRGEFKERIIQLYNSGKSLKEIHEELGISYGMVTSTIARARQAGSVKKKKRSHAVPFWRKQDIPLGNMTDLLLNNMSDEVQDFLVDHFIKHKFTNLAEAIADIVTDDYFRNITGP